jgi:hypothetical protein
MELMVKVHNRSEHFQCFVFQRCDNTVLHPRLKEITACVFFFTEQGDSKTNAPDKYSGAARSDLGQDRDYPDRGPL